MNADITSWGIGFDSIAILYTKPLIINQETQVSQPAVTILVVADNKENREILNQMGEDSDNFRIEEKDWAEIRGVFHFVHPKALDDFIKSLVLLGAHTYPGAIKLPNTPPRPQISH